ncbi:alpha/beta hydrolase [Bacillota bacterium Lsc_1132]
MIENHPVVSGAEPFFFKGNQIGILISHGFVGTPQSVKYLGEQLASQGYTVYGVRLIGHGTHFKDLENCHYQDWIQDLEKGFRFLQQYCSEIFVIGQSMGGTLTLNLCASFPEVKGAILINAAIKTIPVMEGYRNKQKPRFIEEVEPDIKAQDVYEITYLKTPLHAIKQLLSLMDHTVEKLFSVKCPILAFQSIEDHVVPPENTDYIMTNVQSRDKKVIPLFHSFHVASMDNEKEFIAEQCCQFIEKNASKTGTLNSFR